MSNDLKQFGLSDKETSVYLAMLEIGPAVVSDIAKQSGLKRPTVYVILDELGKRGLVSSAERRGVKIFTPAPMETLAKNLENEAKRYKELSEAAKKLAPKLKMKKSEVSGEPRIQLYEGAEGMKQVRSVYEDALSSLESIRAQALNKGATKVYPATKSEFGTVPEITVQGNKIILISPDEKFAAVVESKELAAQLKKIISSSKESGKTAFGRALA